MKNETLLIGNSLINTTENEVKGGFVEIEGEKYYKISHYDQMANFFVSIVSNSDHWMFISSNGSLTAGRKDRDNALFPYYTEDKIHDYKGITGSSSYFRVHIHDHSYLWVPFSDAYKHLYRIENNLYKNMYGNKIIFEEINHDLNLKFQYGWYNSEKYGFVKKSQLENLGNEAILVEILDGIQNILPSGIDYIFQNEYSNLLDAYKKNELLKETQLGIFSLSSIPVDRAEPSESLRATIVWNHGLDNPNVLLSNNQIKDFLKGKLLDTEYDVRANRAAYFVNKNIELSENSKTEWLFVAEINQDSTQVANTNHFLKHAENKKELIESDIQINTEDLKKKISSADGFQMTNTDLCYARHYSNTLYNIMRGGIFANNYLVESSDYKKYLFEINKSVFNKFESWIDALPEKISYTELIAKAEKQENADLLRISYEYLPLTFSRRHGDPSRPWNLFSIETKNEDGSTKYNYQGNWRDIFQNWEALCYSYPEFIEGIICKFVNATTTDGYNPYRIMRDGIDWECPDPDDPWAYIGYWGDHQIIYLQKLLELSNDFHPGKIDELLSKEIFTYANVPYRINSYHDIVNNPKDTIVFDHALNKQLRKDVESFGGDARMLKHSNGKEIYKVNLAEKILVTLLSKISNFIPDAGIWLNTQRPEWNDANNALVGNGTSMVTLYYLRRFLKFWDDKLSKLSTQEIAISEEVYTLFETIYQFLKTHVSLLDNDFSGADRKKFADHLGIAGSDYRNSIYKSSFSGIKKDLKINDLADFIKVTQNYIEKSIENNKREDGLYHAYNLLSIEKDSISIRYLYEMLEGQVAVLSSGYLSPSESLNVLNGLKSSKLFRADQYSYLLYPNRELPRFNEKNFIAEEDVKSSDLLVNLLEKNDTSIISQDQNGKYHFNSDFRNAEILNNALINLDTDKFKLDKNERFKILNIYEKLFDHQSFTGRSGTFYGYEGLGSIYWHMVSKLLLAAQECYFNAIDNKTDPITIGKLKEHYYEIKAGIGLYKSPKLYGAFPTDAYSHTPANAGVKQPGLTGQVKEDVISRFGEMGIRVLNGKINFNISLLNEDEILQKSQDFEYYDLNGTLKSIILNENEIALTLCQVPIIYESSGKADISIKLNDNTIKTFEGNTLDEFHSNLVFKRTDDIKEIKVNIRR